MFNRLLRICFLDILPQLPTHLLERRNNPLATLPRFDIHEIHGIDLLKRAALPLDDEEVNADSSQHIAGRKDVPVPEINVTGNEGREESEQEVPEPVRGGRKRHALGPVARRIQLAANSPDHGAPGGREAEDEEAREDDHGARRFGRVIWCFAVE